MNRQEALDLLFEYTKTDQLRRHGLSVEAVMRAAARKHGEDEEAWGITGLLHDFDYEMYPDQHPMAGKPILEARGVPAEIVYAIQSGWTPENDRGSPIGNRWTPPNRYSAPAPPPPVMPQPYYMPNGPVCPPGVCPNPTYQVPLSQPLPPQSCPTPVCPTSGFSDYPFRW